MRRSALATALLLALAPLAVVPTAAALHNCIDPADPCCHGELSCWEATEEYECKTKKGEYALVFPVWDILRSATPPWIGAQTWSEFCEVIIPSWPTADP